MSSPSASILVADDHILVSDMIDIVLRADGDFSVSRSDSLDSTLSKIESNGHFDIVMLDIGMPGMNGLSGIEKVISANRKGKVVIFSGDVRSETVLKSIEMGASGYMPKTLTARSLCNALKFVMSGEVYLPSDIASNIVRRPARLADALLGEKEIEVLRAVCRGETNKTIALNLSLSEVSVKMYVRSLCVKLGVTNRTQIAVTALSKGLA